jgi:hypothetical protein
LHFSDLLAFSVLDAMSELLGSSDTNAVLFTPQQIAERWQCDAEKVIRTFTNVPGVMDIGNPADVRKRKRAYRILRIPDHVLKQVERKLTAK